MHLSLVSGIVYDEDYNTNYCVELVSQPSTTAPDRAVLAPAYRRTLKPEEVKSSFGEKVYDQLIVSSTYLGTFGASLASAYILKYNHWGNKNIFAPVRDFIEKEIVSKPIFGAARSTDVIHNQAHYVAEIASLMAGGTVPVVPFKILENRRIDIINGLNEKYGMGLNTPEERDAAQKRINDLPLQSWGSALLGRGVAMGATFAAGIPFGTQIEKAQIAIAKPLVNAASLGERLYKYDAERPQFIGKMLVMDGTWSAYTSAILLVFSRLAAPFIGDEKHTPPAAPTQPDSRVTHTQLPQRLQSPSASYQLNG